MERYPREPPMTYNEGDLLRRVERIAADSSADWIIHHDVDERRRAPWPGTSMRDALWAVERSGFNAIDHTVLSFDLRLIPGCPAWILRRTSVIRAGAAPRSASPDQGLAIEDPVQLAQSGGHDAIFAGRRVFLQLPSKHYPLRSQEHAERKIFPGTARSVEPGGASSRLASAVRRCIRGPVFHMERRRPARIRGWPDAG